MRRLRRHQTNEANSGIEITVVDEPGEGGVCHGYRAEITAANGAARDYVVDMAFQKGAIHGAGINGITEEVLLAILIDRLEGFQSGDFACRQNAIVLTKLEEALLWLEDRTREREARGVEGTEEE